MTKNLFIMGVPGIGKTTIVGRIISRLTNLKLGGFYTEEIRENGERVGFNVRTLDGKSRTLSKIGIKSSVSVGEYGVDLETIEKVINPAVERALASADILVMDEIGKMELASQRFQELVVKALNFKIRVVATIPSYSIPFVDSLKRRPDVSIIEVTKNSRDKLTDYILNQIIQNVEIVQN